MRKRAKELKQEQNGSVELNITELTELGSLLGKIKIPKVIMVFQKTEEKKKKFEYAVADN